MVVFWLLVFFCFVPVVAGNCHHICEEYLSHALDCGVQLYYALSSNWCSWCFPVANKSCIDFADHNHVPSEVAYALLWWPWGWFCDNTICSWFIDLSWWWWLWVTNFSQGVFHSCFNLLFMCSAPGLASATNYMTLVMICAMLWIAPLLGGRLCQWTWRSIPLPCFLLLAHLDGMHNYGWLGSYPLPGMWQWPCCLLLHNPRNCFVHRNVFFPVGFACCEAIALRAVSMVLLIDWA